MPSIEQDKIKFGDECELCGGLEDGESIALTFICGAVVILKCPEGCEHPMCFHCAHAFFNMLNKEKDEITE